MFVLQRKTRILVSILSLSTLVGCWQSNSGVQRLRIYGTVTYKGEPVPAGEIRIEPNASKGNSGPVGLARIYGGEFDCADDGKGSVEGHVRVAVTGYVSEEPFAAQLFPQYWYETEITPDSRELIIEVPSN